MTFDIIRSGQYEVGTEWATWRVYRMYSEGKWWDLVYGFNGFREYVCNPNYIRPQAVEGSKVIGCTAPSMLRETGRESCPAPGYTRSD